MNNKLYPLTTLSALLFLLCFSSLYAQRAPDYMLMPDTADANVVMDYGTTVATSGDRIVVGDLRYEVNGSQVGALYIYTWNGSGFDEEKIVGTSNAGFGKRVDISGDRIATSGRDANNDVVVFIYEYDGSSWQRTTVNDLFPAQGNLFGEALALDGDNLVVHSDSGAFVFEYDGSNWNGTELGDFAEEGLVSIGGKANFLSVDGDSVVVGGYNAADPMAGSQPTSFGGAYLYVKNAGSWEETRLFPDTTIQLNDYGHAVSIHNGTVAVGAEGTDAFETSGGAVYLYTYDGTDWSAELVGDGQAASFGDYSQDVQIYNDLLLVGTNRPDVNSFAEPGGIFGYDLNGNFTSPAVWSLDTTGVSTDFGRVVDIDSRFAVTSWREYTDPTTNAQTGAVYVYDMNPVSGRATDLQTQDFAKLYPNPATTTLSIALPADAHNAQLRLVDMQGRLLLESDLQTADNSVRISALPTGVYIAEVRTADRVQRERLVIQR